MRCSVKEWMVMSKKNYIFQLRTCGKSSPLFSMLRDKQTPWAAFQGELLSQASLLKIWLHFLVCCQWTQFWEAPFWSWGQWGGCYGSCGRKHAGRSSSIMVISHQVSIFIHHRKLLLPQDQLYGDVGDGSSTFCLARYPSADSQLKTVPPLWSWKIMDFISVWVACSESGPALCSELCSELSVHGSWASHAGMSVPFIFILAEWLAYWNYQQIPAVDG